MGYRLSHLLYQNYLYKKNNVSVGARFEMTASRVPDKVMMVAYRDDRETDKITFREALLRSRQITRFFQSRGYKKGDVVAIMMQNQVDYPCYWLGLSRIGVIPALINTNIRHGSLIHTFKVVNCKAVIFSEPLQQGMSITTKTVVFMSTSNCLYLQPSAKLSRILQKWNSFMSSIAVRLSTVSIFWNQSLPSPTLR